ncbi:hypothetical protein N305_00246, partial [Manacus vitellinus]
SVLVVATVSAKATRNICSSRVRPGRLECIRWLERTLACSRPNLVFRALRYFRSFFRHIGGILICSQQCIQWQWGDRVYLGVVSSAIFASSDGVLCSTATDADGARQVAFSTSPFSSFCVFNYCNFSRNTFN